MATSPPVTNVPISPFASIYKPLNPSASEIRLLHVPFSMLRNLGQEDPEPLSGKLIHYTLPIGSGSVAKKFVQAVTRRNYTALSYVWGDPHQTHEIIIDGCKFPITYSLYTAITQLQSDFVYGDEFIWVDAICIDQTNNAEKSAQIGMMREVYHNAGNVRVWLGPVEEGDQDKIYQVMQWIQILNDGWLPDKYEKGSSEWWEARYLPYVLKPLGVVAQGTMSGWHKINMFKETFHNSSNDAGNIKLWERDDEERFRKQYLEWKPRPKDLEKFMKLVPGGDLSIVAAAIERYIIREPEWFNRIWVVQEVGVAWEDVDVARGSYSKSWDELLNVIFYLQYTCNIPLPSIDKVTGLEILRLGFRDGKRRRLRDLMYECRFRRATDPRDKIYGLYGLMGDQANQFTKPNYSKSVAEVFAHTTFHFITQAKSLNIICGQQRVGRRQGLPSWVPDYELDGRLAPVSLLPLDGREEALFHASGFDDRSKYALPDPEMSLLEWTLLPAQGIRIGSVEVLSEASEEGESLSQIQRRWRKVLDTYFGYTKHEDEQGLESSLDAITNLIDQYSAYSTTSTPTPNSVDTPTRPQDNSTSTFSNPPEIDTSKLLILSYLNTLITGRSTPTTRATAPYIPPLPSLRASHTQTPQKPALPPRSKTSSFSVPRKAIGSPSLRASTMPSSSTSTATFQDRSASTISDLSTAFKSSVSLTNEDANQSPASQPPQQTSRNPLNALLTTPSTTTATDHTTVPPHNNSLSSEIAKTCAALEFGMRKKRFFVTSEKYNLGCGEGEVRARGILGSAGKEVRWRDVVVVLFGCDVPVILREVVEGFEGEGEGEDRDGEREVGGTTAKSVGGSEQEEGKVRSEGRSEGRGRAREEPGWQRLVREMKEEKEREEGVFNGKGKKWMFVGEAFVDGFMDAEALAWLRRGRGCVEDFNIV